MEFKSKALILIIDIIYKQKAIAVKNSTASPISYNRFRTILVNA